MILMIQMAWPWQCLESQGCCVSGDQPAALPHLCWGPKERERETVRPASPEHLCPVLQGTAGCHADSMKSLLCSQKPENVKH